jgi:hypothetical protein
MKLFLDDIRSPSDCARYMHNRIGKLNPIYLEGNWYIVRNYDEFCKAIEKYHQDITHISFDHDLADGHYNEAMYESEEQYYKNIEETKEKTGLDCAKFFKEFYKDKQVWPTMFVHSMNPIGTQAIINLF